MKSQSQTSRVHPRMDRETEVWSTLYVFFLHTTHAGGVNTVWNKLKDSLAQPHCPFTQQGRIWSLGRCCW